MQAGMSALTRYLQSEAACDSLALSFMDAQFIRLLPKLNTTPQAAGNASAMDSSYIKIVDSNEHFSCNIANAESY